MLERYVEEESMPLSPQGISEKFTHILMSSDLNMFHCRKPEPLSCPREAITKICGTFPAHGCLQIPRAVMSAGNVSSTWSNLLTN